MRPVPATSPGSTSMPTRRTGSPSWRARTSTGSRCRSSMARSGIRSRRSCSSQPSSATPAASGRPPRTSHRGSCRSAGSWDRPATKGMQVDSAGEIWIVEDVGGKAGAGTLAQAKQPNSFVYRFVPKNRWDLTAGGVLQVLQVVGLDHKPIVFGGTTQAAIDADILSQGMKDLHTYGNWFTTNWIKIHDTATDGTTAFDANALAKAAGGTPLKRPENGQFRPASGFKEFFFDETGDTNADSAANASYGGWGAILRLVQTDPRSNHGRLTPFYVGRSGPYRPGQHGVPDEGRGRLRRRRWRRAPHPAERPRIRPICSTSVSTARRRPPGSSRRDATLRRPSTPPSAARRASRTRATTRSPGSTSRTATRRSTGSSAGPHPRVSTTMAAVSRGASSGPSSTATT